MAQLFKTNDLIFRWVNACSQNRTLPHKRYYNQRLFWEGFKLKLDEALAVQWLPHASVFLINSDLTANEISMFHKIRKQFESLYQPRHEVSFAAIEASGLILDEISYVVPQSGGGIIFGTMLNVEFFYAGRRCEQLFGYVASGF